MSFGNTTENAILDLMLRATAWSNYADNAASSPQTNIGLSLHTADPGEAGDASTSEITYTSYTRVNVARSTGFAAASGGSSALAANTDFPAGTGGSGTASFFAAAKSNASPPTGAQTILMSGAVSPTIVSGNGVTPRLTTATTLSVD